MTIRSYLSGPSRYDGGRGADRFGGSYRSLYSLRSFALDRLMIDRGFVNGMAGEPGAAAIVHAIIHFGRALGLEVVPEGVETFAQGQALRLAGASHLQDADSSRPVSFAMR